MNKASHRPPGDLGELYSLARQQGWRIDQRPGRHWRWYPPQGGQMVVTSSTPGRGRAYQNARSQLKAAGLRLHGRRKHDKRQRP